LLLGYYEKIFTKVGKNLHSLISVTENEFQQVALEKAASPHALKENISLEEFWGDALSPSSKPKFNRSPIVAAQAIRMAEFRCEIDAEHWTFISRAKKQRYVEAHHLIPISQQLRFLHPLDIVENVVCLCATCHRMLHYGVEKERRDLLSHLFKQRKESLVKKSLDLKVNDFLGLYSNSILLED
jgi:5-methylcytosine-specific restriction protein A